MLGNGNSSAQHSVVPVLTEPVGKRDKKPCSCLNGSGKRPVQGARRLWWGLYPFWGTRQAFPRGQLLVCSDHWTKWAGLPFTGKLRLGSMGPSNSNSPWLYDCGGHRVKSPYYSDGQSYIWDMPWCVPNISVTNPQDHLKLAAWQRWPKQQRAAFLEAAVLNRPNRIKGLKPWFWKMLEGAEDPGKRTLYFTLSKGAKS